MNSLNSLHVPYNSCNQNLESRWSVPTPAENPTFEEYQTPNPFISFSSSIPFAFALHHPLLFFTLGASIIHTCTYT